MFCSHKRLDQEALAAADIKHAAAGLQTEMRNDIARDRMPAAIIAVAAVAVFARSVPVHFAVLLGDRDDRGVLRFGTFLDVALGLGQRA